MINLIIVNLYGTILPENRELMLRKGFLDFLGRHKSRHIAISTYAPKNVAISDLKAIGLADIVEKVYTQEDMGYVRVYNKERNDLKDGYLQPMLRAWTRVDFHTNEDKAICISNNLLDMMSADWYNIKAIDVPTFNDKNDLFSFDDVLVDSWRSGVRYFAQRLQKKPQRVTLKM